jgi:uracil-DNA glycosylase
MKKIKEVASRKPNKIFRDILNKEIALFQPDLIVTIGDNATAALLPNFNTSQAKALIRYSPQAYNIDGTTGNISLLPMYHISGACGHRFSKYKDVNKDGRYSSWHEWYADEIVKNLKVTSS